MAAAKGLGDLAVVKVIKFLKKRSFASVKAKELGIGLGVPEAEIEGFEYNYPKFPEKVLMEVIGYWLANDVDKSWAKLAEALRLCSYGNAAKEIEDILGLGGSGPVDKRPEFNMKSLSMLKIEADGKVTNFHLLEEICNKWYDMGSLIGLGLGRLQSIETTNMKNPMECCRDVLGDWMRQGKGEGDYEPNWDGLIDLLRAVEMNSVANQLEEIMK